MTSAASLLCQGQKTPSCSYYKYDNSSTPYAVISAHLFSGRCTKEMNPLPWLHRNHVLQRKNIQSQHTHASDTYSHTLVVKSDVRHSWKVLFPAPEKQQNSWALIVHPMKPVMGPISGTWVFLFRKGLNYLMPLICNIFSTEGWAGRDPHWAEQGAERQGKVFRSHQTGINMAWMQPFIP